jgi:hypothetical protein
MIVRLCRRLPETAKTIPLQHPHHTGRSPFTVTRVPERVCGQ